MKLRTSRRSYLPDDLMVEVIRRLPLKYMVRFRCVNKSWYRFIGTSSFTKSTISNTNNNNNRYLLCTHRDYYTVTDLSGEADEFTDNINKLKYYKNPELYGVHRNLYPCDQMAKVHGICNGLLCVSDSYLHSRSRIYLWNPIIRKAKKISMIPPAQVRESVRDADLCFGYFHDDYKVIRIAPCCAGKKFRLGVYSFSTDSWKVTYFDSAYATDPHTWMVNHHVPDVRGAYYLFSSEHPCNKFVGGVAYFLKYEPILICFDLCRERIREVKFPDEFFSQKHPCRCSLEPSLEPCGESIALIGSGQGHFTKWILRNCDATNTSTWEKIITVKSETPHNIVPLGFTKHGKYLLTRDCFKAGLYSWNFGISSQLEECTSYTWINNMLIISIDSLAGNLVLLDEKNLDPSLETEPCSTQNIFVLHKLPPLRNKKITYLLDTTQKRMEGRRTNRRIEQPNIKKPREKGGKDMSDNTHNQLQGMRTKRRKEETKMEKPRKKERKEMLDKMQNVLQGTGAKRRMEESETEKPRKKGRKETLYKTHSMLQGWGSKRSRD